MLGLKLKGIPFDAGGIRTHLEKKIRQLDNGMARLRRTQDDELV